jgi:acyl dehydratase
MSHLPSAPVTLAVGDALPQTTVGPLSRTDFVRYAGAGGDFNPIHHDEPFAQAAGRARARRVEPGRVVVLEGARELGQLAALDGEAHGVQLGARDGGVGHLLLLGSRRA